MNFKGISDNIEKLSFPLKIGDEYDTGAKNEVLAQIHVFQGVLDHLNEIDAKSRPLGNLHRELPVPILLRQG